MWLKYLLPGSWLVTLTFGALFLYHESIDPRDVLSARIDNKLASFDASIEELSISLSEYDDPSEWGIDVKEPIRLYHNGELILWNHNLVLPQVTGISVDTTFFLRNKDAFIFSSKTLVLGKGEVFRVDYYLPVFIQYKVINQYLTPEFDPNLFRGMLASWENPDSTIETQGKYLFDVQLKLINIYLPYLLAFLLISLATSCIFLLRWFNRRMSNKLVFLLVSIILVIPFKWITAYLFLRLEQPVGHFLYDPRVFTLGFWVSNMAELIYLLLLILIVAQSFLQNGYRLIRIGWIQERQDAWRVVILAVSMLIAFVLSFWCVQSTWLLLDNSVVILDISKEIPLEALQFTGFIVFALTGLAFFSIYHVLLKLVMREQKTWVVLLALGLTTLIFFLFPFRFKLFIVLFQVIFFMLCRFFPIQMDLRRLSQATFIYLLFVVALISAFSSLAIYKYHEFDDRMAKRRFSNHIFIQNDIMGELYLNEAIQGIKDDPSIRVNMLNQSLARTNVQDKIVRQHISSYFNKYHIEILLFDAEGRPYGDHNSLAYWQAIYLVAENETRYPDLYFYYDRDQDRSIYLGFVEIAGYNKKVGNILLKLTQKKYIPKSVFPSLLLAGGNTDDEFDYAMYQDRELKYQRGKKGFDPILSSRIWEELEIKRSGVEFGGEHLLGIPASADKMLVIRSSVYPWRAIAANFSFLVLIGMMIIGIYFLLDRLIYARREFSLSNKIQLYIGVSFFIPLLLVSVLILNLLNNSYKDEINRNYQKRARNVAENMVDITDQYQRNLVNRDALANAVNEISQYVQADLVVYDEDGKLLVTSQSEIFEKELISDLINYKAWNFMKKERDQAMVLNESIGRLRFKASYYGIRSYDDGRLLAILKMPFFDSKNHLKRQQIEVFNNLVTVFCFIFLLSLLFGNIALKNLTDPVKMIAAKLRKTTLQMENEPLQYSRRDEIGLLVNEYNEMVSKLELSKEALARSQKEAAWKEIARQVAHEIKNPLTPMRLKIQQLMRDIPSEDIQYKAMQSLLGQIDTLATIADSFSAFAQMPAPENQELNLSEIVQDVSSLYRNRDAEIRTDIEEGVMVFSDPKLISRVLNNLILNAIQSVRETIPEINIRLKIKDKKARLSIEDNGTGIEEELKDKVFKPYFSTKEKGSGIGLAIAKKGIEQADGDIWFESQPSGGTTFFVVLPLHQA